MTSTHKGEILMSFEASVMIAAVVVILSAFAGVLAQLPHGREKQRGQPKFSVGPRSLKPSSFAIESGVERISV